MTQFQGYPAFSRRPLLVPYTGAKNRKPVFDTIGNPGDYFAGSVSTANDALPFPGSLGFTDASGDYNPPGEIIVFIDSQNKQYNCVEIDLSYGKTDRGYCVPDLVCLQPESPVAERWTENTAQNIRFGRNLYICMLSVSGLPGGLMYARMKGEWPSFGIKNAIMFQPQKIYLAPDPAFPLDRADSTQARSTDTFSAVGLYPFSKLAFYIVKANTQFGEVYYEQYQRPTYTVRVWFDPEKQNLHRG